MRVVLYAHDMEPITVLELSSWAYDFLQKHGRVTLAVPQEVKYHPPEELKIDICRIWTVDITAEILTRNGERHMMLFTHNEEQALLIKAGFLPGQRSTLRDHERKAFADGFINALGMLRGAP